LAELYIRKAKSGRFFDLYQDLVKKQTSIDKQTIASTKPSLRKAIATLKDIEESHPKFDEMDVVFFNIANAYNALNESTSAEIYFENLIQRYPNSALRPDALLAYGEILYQKGKFESALKNFDEIKNFPESKAYPYSLYKSAWCSYNLKQNESAINKLVSSLELNNKMLTDIQKHSLRSESIKDLVLFSSETKKSDEIIDFFKKITNQSEFDEAMLALAKLYESHSRYKELIEFLEDYKEETTPRNQSWAQEFIINSLESLKKTKRTHHCFKRIFRNLQKRYKFRPSLFKNFSVNVSRNFTKMVGNLGKKQTTRRVF
jgi:tetratricopeptide (TPR) repeat protein